MLEFETESKQKPVEALAERVKIKGQKKSGDKPPDTTGMSDLESEETAAQRRYQNGQGLKILTPDQMLSRLPFFLAQIKAGITI